MKKYPKKVEKGSCLTALIIAIIFCFITFKLIERKENIINNDKKNIAVAQAIIRGDKVSFESVCWVRDMLSLSLSYEKSLLNAGLTENDIFLLKKGDVRVKFSAK
jgi:hypothetical protein